MKKILIILCILITFLSCELNLKDLPSNKNTEGFLDISWGSNASTALDILERKNFSIITSNDEIILAEGKFGGNNGSVWLKFCEKGLYSGEIWFWNKNYKYGNDDFVSMLKNKYGEPNDATSPDYDFIFTEWNFENNYSLTLTYHKKSIWVSLWYRNDTIWNEEHKEFMENEINEF